MFLLSFHVQMKAENRDKNCLRQNARIKLSCLKKQLPFDEIPNSYQYLKI